MEIDKQIKEDDIGICSCGMKHNENNYIHEEEENNNNNNSIEVWNVKLKHKKEEHLVPIMKNDNVSQIIDFVKEVYPYEYVKIIHKGTILDPNKTIQDQNVQNGDIVKLVASTKEGVHFIQSNKSDPTIRGFKEERLLEQRRKALDTNMNQQDSQYKFCKIQVLQHYTTPHPYEAEKLLERLATDPGIVFVMKKRKFTVGYLREMDINEHFAKKKEADGGCLLGYNENAGASISLRLRTDDLKEFRGYRGIINTLLHELTHNVWGEHDANFWKLFAELKSEYLQFLAVEARQGRATAGISASIENFDQEVDNQLRNEMSNRAHTQNERNGAAQVVAERKERLNEQPKVNQPVPPAKFSVARMEMRERAIRAAESRMIEISNNQNNNSKTNTNNNQNNNSTIVNNNNNNNNSKTTTNNNQNNNIPNKNSNKINKLKNDMDIQSNEHMKNNINNDNSKQIIFPFPLEKGTREERLLNAISIFNEQMDSHDAKKLILLILKNIIDHPNDDKYTRIRYSSKKFVDSIGKFESAMEFLLAIGFEVDGPDYIHIPFGQVNQDLITFGLSLLQSTM